MRSIRSPELPQNYPWLNTDKPFSLKQLRGRIVILDFWTYCCINCLHVLPDLKYLEQKYKNSVTVIGIHSAKFENEKETENIRQAILRYDIEHPVLVDKDFRVWQEYAVKAYPTFVVIDPQGYIVATLTGEGKRQILDELIEKLIQQYQEKDKINFQEIDLILEKQKTPLITPLAFPGKVLATDSKLFIADSGHHRIIVSDLDGEVLHVIGSGQPGLKDDSFTEAEFFAPQGMAFDDVNNILYIADTENHAIRKIDFQNQKLETIAGIRENLNSPWDLVKLSNKLFIVMAGSHQIWELDLESNIIKNYAGRGAESCFDGSLSESAFAQPSGITTDGKKLYIADSEVSSIRSIDLEKGLVKTICGSGDLNAFGDVDGQGFNARLQHCLGIEYADNNLWIADTYNHKIKLVNPVTGDCQSVLENNSFSEPSGLTFLDGYLYIADTNNHVIRKMNLSTLFVETIKFSGLCSPDVCLLEYRNPF
ncbi:redoxin domain-containing protein [Calothrix parasitica NIES-267]|uniref:Redoxin domain-containing protein n=1 Tax=Calothrix parasitica NIES-267 TaxID=1973488 RepID=A0A1Z4LI62_9CYAN|nr:redoxin domain-containing protein [Calothrix parasitica NIES-267]